MHGARSLPVVALALCLIAAPNALAQRDRHGEHGRSGRSPKSTLLRSMMRGRRVALTAVMVQRLSRDADTELEIKVDQDGEGSVRITTLYPRMWEGVVWLDDGVTWKTFFPKDRRVMVQQSPKVAQGNPRYELALADQNYKLSRETAGSIVDRPTVCVVAVPNSKELNQRRYYIDAETSFMLRMETVAPDGVKTVLLDTRALAYGQPASMDLGDDSSTRVVKMADPVRVAPPSAARSTVGFTPLAPDQVPLGFIVKETQIIGSREDKFIAVRLTDGLVQATVYQWDASHRSRHWPFSSHRDYREYKGVRMTVVGELPSKARQIVLAAFAQ